jgi:hypothetical protein
MAFSIASGFVQTTLGMDAEQENDPSTPLLHSKCSKVGNGKNAFPKRPLQEIPNDGSNFEDLQHIHHSDNEGIEDRGESKPKKGVIWPESISAQDITAMRIVQKTVLYSGKSLDEATPQKLGLYRKLGGKTPKLRELCLGAATQFSPIRNLQDFPDQDLSPSAQPPIFSPVARGVLDRRSIIDAKRTGAVISYPSTARVIPIKPETAEERAQRKVRQAQDFLEAVQLRGLFQIDIDARMQSEYDIWQDHLNYIRARKRSILGFDEIEDEDAQKDELEEEALLCEMEEVPDGMNSSKTSKIRKGEIEDSFGNFVAAKLTYRKVGKYDLYWQRDLLDLDFVINGMSNRQRMLQGKNPIGWDGESMEYHHLTHHDAEYHNCYSVIVLITYSLHKMPGFHYRDHRTYADKPQTFQRMQFNKQRPEFNKEIAQQLDSSN